MAVANAALACGTSRTSPNSTIITAPAIDTTSGVRPIAGPNEAVATPSSVKVSDMPAASAIGPKRLTDVADASAIGMTGRTQGFISVSKPAR